jgi:dihydropteroate synthase
MKLPGGPTRIFGILNVTPDSFSDGGDWTDPIRAERRGLQMAAEGAAVIDIGGQSTRPGHVEIGTAEELLRVLPVIERLSASGTVPLSIDTTKPEVARAALSAGASILNDIDGFQGEPAMPGVASEFGCPVVLMHRERDFAEFPGDPMDRIRRYFERSLAIADAAGVSEVILDPGIGFHKTPEQSLEIMARLAELKAFGRPILLGASRKSVIGHVLGGTPADRLEGTLATTVLAVVQGVDFVRVHDVLANARAIRMAFAVLRGRTVNR